VTAEPCVALTVVPPPAVTPVDVFDEAFLLLPQPASNNMTTVPITAAKRIFLIRFSPLVGLSIRSCR
jgi:hypothetical protein